MTTPLTRRAGRGSTWLGAIILSVYLLLAGGTGKAAAEDWERAGSIPMEIASGFNFLGVNAEGTVLFTRDFGKSIYRWTPIEGQQIIGTAGTDCYWGAGGIADSGIAMSNQVCQAGVSPAFYTTNQAYAWGPESTVPSSSNLPFGYRIFKVNPGGKFIGSNFKNTLNRLDDESFSGIASVDVQTGTLLVGTTTIGAGHGIDISPDGSILTSKPGDSYGALPDAYFRDGGPSGPFMKRAAETAEIAHGFLPDEKVLASVFVDPESSSSLTKLMAYDGVTPYEVPQSGGGLDASSLSRKVILGGNDKAIYGLATGTSVPDGTQAIVTWSSFDAQPQATGIYTDSTSYPVGEPKVASRDGAWLVLDNGDVWRDLDANAPLPPGAICLDGVSGDRACVLRAKATPRLKKIAQTQVKVYDGQISGFARVFGRLDMIEAGATTQELEQIMGSAGAGLSAKVVSAINARNYWQTVAQDPPDPKYRTTAKPRKVSAGRIGKFRGLSAKENRALKAWVTAQLRYASFTACGIDAINRGATAFDKGSAQLTINQYRAGNACAKKAGVEAKKIGKTGPAAAKAAAALIARAKQAGAGKVKKRPSNVAIKKSVNRQVAATAKLIQLTAAEKMALKKALTPSRGLKPGLANLAGMIRSDSKKVNGTSGQVGQSGSFMTDAMIKG